MKSVRLVILVSIAVLCASDVLFAQDELAEIPRGWFFAMQREGAKQAEMLCVAYDLNNGQREVLIKELDRRILDQWAYEQNRLPVLSELAKTATESPNDEIDSRVLRELSKYTAEMPMDPYQVADWLEESYLPREQASKGRVKYRELRARDLQFASLSVADQESNVAVGRELRTSRAKSIAKSNAVQQFLPAGTQVPKWQIGHVVSWNILHADRQRAQKVVDRVSPNLAMSPLPCFADWRHAAQQSCHRSRLEKPAALGSIWQEFTMRAWRRIALEPDTFNEILESDSNARVAEILDERGMQSDLDALFLEFKIRLEALEAECTP